MGKRIGAVGLAALLLLLPIVPRARAAAAPAGTASLSAEQTIPAYTAYLGGQEEPTPFRSLSAALIADGSTVQTEDGKTAARLDTDGAKAQFTADIPEAGLYRLELTFCLTMENTANAAFSLYIDGALPYTNVRKLAFPHRYVPASAITQDKNGNDRVPEQSEVKEWTAWVIDDRDVETSGGLYFRLTAGRHTFTVETETGGVSVADLRVLNREEPPAYADYLAALADKAGQTPDDYCFVQEAEGYTAVSDSVIHPTYDRSDAATSPNDPRKLRLNTVGQSNWNKAGQWIEWTVDIPADGWYELGLRARQNELRGAFSTRRLYIDGELPFAEAASLRFAYQLGWQTAALGGEQGAYRFYLTAGTHTLRLEAAQGAVAECLSALNDLTLELNTLYRNILMVTGTSVDTYRDYMLEQQIPELISRLTSAREVLQEQVDRLTALGIGKGSGTAAADKLIYQLDSFIRSPRTIPGRLNDFLSNISSVSSWAMSFSDQPLEVDYLYIKAPGAADPAADSGFFAQLRFRFLALLASYTEDYTSLAGSGGETADRTIRVWVASGRDQGQIIKDLTESRFTPEEGIAVQISLMQTGLNEAIAAGRGPDVALFTGDVVNLASRGALMDLSACEGFADAAGRFSPEALVPFTYRSGVYALPLEQTVLMLFCRTDIFDELSLTVPTTWEEFTNVLTALQKNRLTAGLYAGTSTAGDTSVFELMLYQQGGSLFNADLTETVLDSELCYRSFKQWTDFYTEYGLPTEFDFFNRFRAGAMPIGIQAQSMYTTLRLAAPELDGLWTMYPVPQTAGADGTRSDLTIGGVTPAIVLSGADANACFAYLRWLTGADIQTAYGREVENRLGMGARYHSANPAAVAQLNWTKEESTLLIGQLEKSRIRPSIPAGYYINRNLTNAFRKVVISGYTPREALLSYNRIINSEIARKNRELAAHDTQTGKKED